MSVDWLELREQQWEYLNQACKEKRTIIVPSELAAEHPLYSGVNHPGLQKRLRVKSVFLVTGWGKDSYGQRRGYSKSPAHMRDERYNIRVLCQTLDGKRTDYEFSAETVMQKLFKQDEEKR